MILLANNSRIDSRKRAKNSQGIGNAILLESESTQPYSRPRAQPRSAEKSNLDTILSIAHHQPPPIGVCHDEKRTEDNGVIQKVLRVEWRREVKTERGPHATLLRQHFDGGNAKRNSIFATEDVAT